MPDNQEFIGSIKRGELEQVRMWLERDASLVDSVSESGLPAVLLAMYYEQREIGHLLVAHGARLDIFSAAAVGQTDHLQALLDRQPQLANAYAQDGFQPLGLAAFFGQVEAARLLVERGAAVNSASNNPQSVMPLHSAVASQGLEIARLLLEHGADPNAVQSDDFTPLQGAAQNGQIEMVQLLLEYHADINAVQRQGQTALSIAQQQGYSQIVELLRQHGAR